MHLLKASMNGNPNIGLYAYANDSFLLVGKEVPVSQAEEFGKVLNVPVHRITIAGTSLVGVFVAGNSKKIIIPDIVFEDERKKLDELGIEYEIISTHLTALGNNVLANDNGALINPEFKDSEMKAIENALGVPTDRATIAGLDIVGSCAAINTKGGVAHREIEEDEAATIKKVLKIDVEGSTINLGSPYVRSGIVANSNGFIAGELSGGPEVSFTDESLGFIEV